MRPREDNLRWSFTKDERVSVKSAYHYIRERNRTGDDNTPSGRGWMIIWNTQVWPKVKLFMWKFAANAIPVRSNLQRRGFVVTSVCPSCAEEETRDHALTGCWWTRDVWDGVLNMKMNDAQTDSLTAWLLGGAAPSFVNGPTTRMTWELCMYTC